MYVAQDTVSHGEENVLTSCEFPVFKSHSFCKTMSFCEGDGSHLFTVTVLCSFIPVRVSKKDSTFWPTN